MPPFQAPRRQVSAWVSTESPGPSMILIHRKHTHMHAQTHIHTHQTHCCCSVTQSCLTLWNPMDCSPPGSSVHGISQARTLEWVTIFFSRGSLQPRDGTPFSCIGRWVLYDWATREAPHTYIHTCMSVFTMNGYIPDFSVVMRCVYIHTHTYLHICICIYMYVCIYMMNGCIQDFSVVMRCVYFRF